MRQNIINIFLEYNQDTAGSAIPVEPGNTCRTITTGRLDGGKVTGGEGRETPMTPPCPGRWRELPLPVMRGFTDTQRL